MLKEEEIQRCLQNWSFLCKLRFYPLELDPKTGKKFQRSGIAWRRWLSYIHFTHMVIHVMWASFRFFKGLAMGEYNEYSAKSPYILIWDLLVVNTGFIAFWYWLFFFRHADVFLFLLNYAFDQETAESTRRSGLVGYLKCHTRQELAAIWFPHVSLLTVVGITGVFTVEHRFKTSIISGLPEESQNSGYVVGLWLVEEFWYYSGITANAFLVVTMHVLCLEKFLKVLKRLRKNTHVEGHAKSNFTFVTTTSLKELRQVQYNVKLFNEAGSYAIFVLKCLCILFAILTGSCAIVFVRKSPVLGIFFTIIFFEASLTYPVVYEKAFEIPKGVRDLKRSMLLAVQTWRRSEKEKIRKSWERLQRAVGHTTEESRPRRYFSFSIISREQRWAMMMEREARATPVIGIRSGDFHTIDQASMLIYFDFILANLVGLLITLRQP